MCNPRVEIAKKKKRLRGLKNEIAKTGNNLNRLLKTPNFNLEDIQKITSKLHDLTEEKDRLKQDIFLLEKSSNEELVLSPA